MSVRPTSQTLLRVILLFLDLALIELARADVSGSSKGDFRYESIFTGGKQRTYLVFVPSRLPNPAPLVFIFHGAQLPERGIDSILEISHFDRIAEEHQFLAVFPEAYKGIWNDGRVDHHAKSYSEEVDDIGFVRAMLDKTEHQFRVDPGRVYATGFSSGGIFCHYLAGQRSEMLAAIATVSGPMATPNKVWFHPESPLSVLDIHGTKDPFLPYKGGNIIADGGQVLSAEATAELWAQTDKCRPRYIQLPFPAKLTSHRCYPQSFEWTKGKDNTTVVLYRIVGGGHTWPGSPPGFPANLFVGPVCRDFDASELIWKFFERHPKRALPRPDLRNP